MIDPDSATQPIAIGRATLPMVRSAGAVPTVHGRSPTELSAEDMRDLVQNARRQDRYMDYFRRLPEKSKASVERLLQSITSLANASGGIVIFGIDAKDGVPTKVAPLKNLDQDRDSRRLDALFSEHVDPPLVDPRWHALEDSAGHFLVLEIPQSLHGPHAIVFDGPCQFWSRDAGGRHLMLPTQLRDAFQESEKRRQDTVDFRSNRVSGALRGDLAFTAGTPGLFLHILPVGRLESNIDADALELDWRSHLKPGRLILGWTSRRNLDGWLGYAHYKGETSAYTQYFRHGGIEVFAHLSAYSEASSGVRVLNGRMIERDIISWLDKGVTWLRAADRQPPYAVCLTMTGVEGLRLCNRGMGKGDPVQGQGFDQQNAHLPTLILDSVPEHVADPMRASFDIMWQAAGWASSPGYDARGTWVPVQ